MVAGFHRSISFPGSPRHTKTRPSSAKSYHVRSISLPCASHPLISKLEDQIRSVDCWRSDSASTSTSSSEWLCDGLLRIQLLNISLHDLFQSTHNQDVLRSASGSEWTERILDDFLRFADAHSTFRSELLDLNQLQSEAHVAIRRDDATRLAACVRSMKKAEKQLLKLASSLQEICNKTSVSRKSTSRAEEAELAELIRDVINATAGSSASVFLGFAALTAAATAKMAAKGSWMQWRKKNDGHCSMSYGALERLQGMEECISTMDIKSERVLRCFINTRVSLLSLLTPSL